MAHIAITGADGNVGSTAVEAFDHETHKVTPITHTETEGMESVVADVSDREAFVEKLPEDADVLVHLAANPSPYAEWDELKDVNVEGAYNAYYAADENDVGRVVYASSNHATNGHIVADPDEPETMRAGTDVIDPDDETAPDSFYGVTKVAGEAMGNYFAHREGVEAVNLRIGWLLSEEDLKSEVTDPVSEEYAEEASRFARAMWLSPRDCEDAVRAASLADLPEEENSVTVNAISANDERCLSLTHGLRTIGYRPRDNAAEVIESN